MADKTIIAVCASASLYDQVIDFVENTEHEGLDLILPANAEKIRNGKLQSKEAVIDFATDKDAAKNKQELIWGHFKEIENSDAVLIMNFEKTEWQTTSGAMCSWRCA